MNDKSFRDSDSCSIARKSISSSIPATSRLVSMTDHWQLSRAWPLVGKGLGLIILSLHFSLSQSSYCLYSCSTQVLQSQSSRSHSPRPCPNTEQTGCSLPQRVYSPQPIMTSCNCQCSKAWLYSYFTGLISSHFLLLAFPAFSQRSAIL